MQEFFSVRGSSYPLYPPVHFICKPNNIEETLGAKPIQGLRLTNVLPLVPKCVYFML